MLRAGQTKGEVESVPTEVVLQIFADRIMVLVTQLGKVGTLVRLERYQNGVIAN